MNSCLLVAAFLFASATHLSGRVVDSEDQPIDGAIVVVSTAKPRVGPSTMCPSCYPDCAKRTLTDAGGRFTLPGVSSKLLFRLGAGGPGYQGLISETYFDPAEDSDIFLRLERLPHADDVIMATGTITNAKGRPIAGAEVRSRTIYRSNGRVGGLDRAVTPLTLTDDQGRFQVTAAQHIRSIDLRVRAAGYAPQDVPWDRGISEDLSVSLGRGASLRGRLLSPQGQPISGVEMGLVQENRSIGNIVTPAEVSTDEDGYFQFDQLPPKIDYAIYTHTGQDAGGALPVSLVAAPEHGERAQLGDVTTQAPHQISITVSTEDGSRLPKDSSVYVGRSKAWRGSRLKLATEATATVVLKGLPSEAFNISIRVPGFEVLRTTPVMNVDLNRYFGLAIEADTAVSFVVRKQGAKAPEKSLTMRQ